MILAKLGGIRGRGVSCLFADVSPKTRTLITMPSRSGRIRAKSERACHANLCHVHFIRVLGILDPITERESFQVAINDGQVKECGEKVCLFCQGLFEIYQTTRNEHNLGYKRS